jgi:hypothetical protein
MTDPNRFWAESAFRGRWGTGETLEGDAPASAAVDPLLSAFWQLHGRSRFGEGFLVFDSPERLRRLVEHWAEPVPGVPFLRTAWGHVFVADGDAVTLIDPLLGQTHAMGCDAVTVIDALLVSDGFLDDSLDRGIYFEAIRRLGRSPGTEECTCYVPALALGGPHDADHVEIGDLQVTMDLLAQMA